MHKWKQNKECSIASLNMSGELDKNRQLDEQNM